MEGLISHEKGNVESYIYSGVKNEQLPSVPARHHHQMLSLSLPYYKGLAKLVGSK